MENSQSVNHRPNQLIEPKVESTNTKLGSKSRSNIFTYVLAQHPLLLLGGCLTMIFGVAALAFYSLSHVGGAEPVETEPLLVVVEEPIKITPENSNPTPLWMVMAIALSCGSGCYLIFRLLNPSTQPQKIPKRFHSHQKALKSLPQGRWEAQGSQRRKVFAPVLTLPAKTKSLVEVLPPAEEYRLNKGKESLADLMDIRKDNSLSMLLQKH